MTVKPIVIFWLAATPALAVDFDATLDWSQRVALSVPVSGIVTQVAVQPGQTVRKNELLLNLNPGRFEAGVMEARADIDRLTREEDEARKELERAQELYARTVSSTTELDAAKLRHARAVSLLAAAQARVEKARAQLDESVIRAPFDAVVLDRQVEPGMATGQCQPMPLLTVARADEILARAEVSAQLVSNIPLGQAATVLADGRSHPGFVRAIRAASAGRYLLEVTIARPSNLLAGMAVKIRLP